MTEAYPLAWPDGWPRTPAHHRQSDHRFGGSRRLTMGRAVDQLVNELRLLGASNVIVSSNMPTKSDGLPYSDQRRIDDPGIAVYFDFKKKPLVMATGGGDCCIGIAKREKENAARAVVGLIARLGLTRGTGGLEVDDLLLILGHSGVALFV